MKAGNRIGLFRTLEEQYQYMNLPLDLIRLGSTFTIFNLADLKQPLPFSLPVSRLNFFVFGFIKHAIGSYTIDEYSFSLRPHRIYFTNPGHFRSFEYTGITEAYLITFDETFLKENLQLDFFEEFPFLLTETVPAITANDETYAEFESIYLQINLEYNRPSLFRNKIIAGLFYILMLKYKEHFGLNYNPIYEGNRGSEIVRQFKKDLDLHFRDISAGTAKYMYRAQNYAEAQNLHPNYLSQVIKSKTGRTIGTWISEKTINEVKSLLQNTAFPIKEIAFRLGFNDSAHMSNYFKKQVGLSPLSYRKRSGSKNSL
ncbi:helix-turn-helix domain-containing protein [Pedobacter miscanthi]|uniref:helix-turn-helix domain-containing protein n=1 Tax=Pedobacter miscanthi TaxID=2259170 RepID=UPI00293052C7|nr:helix-turn-helix domain-containing protein [Pedobacter miscanthi]